MERRWLIGLGPPVLAALVVGAVSTPPVGAADRAWAPPPCPDGAGGVGRASTDVPASAAPVLESWWTLDPQLDDAGTLAGQRLRLGIGSQRSRYIELPPESMVAGPFGRLVLVVADDERRSEIRAIDARLGCASVLGGASDVIRDVTLEPGGTAVWEFRVDRATRADLGVWRRPLDGTSPRRVLPPPPGDERFGRTWSTSLGWSVEGDRLIVESCGAEACRARIVDPDTLRSQWLDSPSTGELVGLVGGTAVTYAACDALPCPIVATDLASGARRVLAPAAGAAAVVPTPFGPRIVLETAAGAEIRRLDGLVERVVSPPEASLRLLPTVLGATARPGLPSDWVAWSADGRSPRNAAITRLTDGRTVPVVEVQP